jgi:hypothetical protein
MADTQGLHVLLSLMCCELRRKINDTARVCQAQHLINCMQPKPWTPAHRCIALIAATNAKLAVVKLQLAAVHQSCQVNAIRQRPQAIAHVERTVLELVQQHAGSAVGCIRGNADKVNLVVDHVVQGSSVNAWHGVARSAGSTAEDPAKALVWCHGVLVLVQGIEVQTDTNLDICKGRGREAAQQSRTVSVLNHSVSTV